MIPNQKTLTSKKNLKRKALPLKRVNTTKSTLSNLKKKTLLNLQIQMWILQKANLKTILLPQKKILNTKTIFSMREEAQSPSLCQNIKTSVMKTKTTLIMMKMKLWSRKIILKGKQ